MFASFFYIFNNLKTSQILIFVPKDIEFKKETSLIPGELDEKKTLELYN